MGEAWEGGRFGAAWEYLQALTSLRTQKPAERDLELWNGYTRFLGSHWRIAWLLAEELAPDNGLVRAGRRVAYSMAMADGELCRRMNREQGPALQLALPWKVAMRAYEENWKILGLFGGELVQFCLLGYAHLTVDVYAAAELEREIPEEDFLDSERVNGVKGTVWGCIPAGWLLAAMVAGMVVSIRTRIWRLTRENRRGKGWQGWPTMIFRYGQKLLWPGRGLRAAEACWGERLEW